MILAELVTYLATQGIGTAGTNLFYGLMKEQYPDVVVVVQENGGTPDEPDLGVNKGQTVRLENPEIVVICRGVRDDYDTPRQKAEDVRTALMKITNQTLSGVKFLVAETRPPGFRRFDDNFRNEFGVPARVTKLPG